MTFSIFVPDGEGPFPVLYWLSGLTCTANNFTEKAGAFRRASQRGLIIVAPDTSPRGASVPDDPAADLGQAFGATLTEREVRYLMTNEWAMTAEDIVWRRSKLGLRLSDDEIAALDDWIKTHVVSQSPLLQAGGRS